MTRRLRRAAVAFMLLAMAVAGLAGCASGPRVASAAEHGTPPRTQTWTAPSSIVSGPGTGDMLVHGTVRAGDSDIEGAQVSVLLLPEDDQSPPGSVIKTWESPTVRTDSSGRWAISITPDAIPDDYFPESRDYLNFELRIWDGARLANWSTTGWWLKGARVWRTDGAAGTADAVMALGVDLESGQIAVTDSFGATERSPLTVVRPEGP